METRFKSKITTVDSTLGWHCFIQVPEKIAKKFIDGKDRRIICSINNVLTIQAALMPSKEGYSYILLNKANRNKLKLKENENELVEVVLTKDNSEYGVPVPEFFKELCYQDPEGNNIFHALTIGKQRSLLHYIIKPKAESKQLEKALIIFDYLKSVNGKLDYKELMEAFKTNRFRT